MLLQRVHKACVCVCVCVHGVCPHTRLTTCLQRLRVHRVFPESVSIKFVHKVCPQSVSTTCVSTECICKLRPRSVSTKCVHRVRVSTECVCPLSVFTKCPQIVSTNCVHKGVPPQIVSTLQSVSTTRAQKVFPDRAYFHNLRAHSVSACPRGMSTESVRKPCPTCV